MGQSIAGTFGLQFQLHHADRYSLLFGVSLAGYICSAIDAIANEEHIMKERIFRESRETFPTSLEWEQADFNKLTGRDSPIDLKMKRSDIDRYDHPSDSTSFPLEYAFHLLGDVEGKTVIDFACGTGLKTAVLASLGAKVLSIDKSRKSLNLTGDRARANGLSANVTLIHADLTTIPVGSCSVDSVLCTTNLTRADGPRAAKEIRRILKPGGVAVFINCVGGSQWFGQIENLNGTIGREDRRREFQSIRRILVWGVRKEIEWKDGAD